MAMCAVCECSLNDSQVLEDGSKEFKSCPKCSVEAGVHVFYKAEDFGFREMGDGRHIIQSWCPSCRSGENPSIPEAFRCK